jgi:phosphatidate cytidylyltransferase
MFFADTLTVTLMRALALLFGLGGIGIVAAVRGNFARLTKSVLWIRYRTWIVLTSVFTLAVTGGRWAIVGLAATFAVVAACEFATMMGLRKTYTASLLIACLSSIAIATVAPDALVWLSGLALLAGVGPGLLRRQPGDMFQATRAMLGTLYLGWPLALLVLLADKPLGAAWVGLALLGTAVSDVAAFSLGSMLGGPKLCPLLSPSKTWMGAVGNILGAAIALVLMLPALPPFPPLAGLLLVAAIGLGSIGGDLIESMFKRACGIKDAGAWLPGFGGLLDRIDSLLLVAPLLYGAVWTLGS